MSSVRAVVYTCSHVYAGTLAVTERLQETLSNPLTDFVDVSSVNVFRLGVTGVGPRLVQQVTIPKRSVQVVTLDEPADSSGSHRKEAKAGREVFVTTPRLEIVGTGHMRAAPDVLSRILTQQLSLFFPVTSATVGPADSEQPPISTELALVNRELVTAFALL